jgi:hypothetical protein
MPRRKITFPEVLMLAFFVGGMVAGTATMTVATYYAFMEHVLLGLLCLTGMSFAFSLIFYHLVEFLETDDD